MADPLANAAPSWTPYGSDDPMRFTDPDGMYEYSDGYGTHESRNSTESMSFSGAYGVYTDDGKTGGPTTEVTTNYYSKSSSNGGKTYGEPTLVATDVRYEKQASAGGGGPSPWAVGWEWLTGKGPRHRNFTNGDNFTEMLRQHEHVSETREIIKDAIANGGELADVNPYSLGGLKGVPKYFKDYSTLLTAGKTGNLAVTYLGSFNLTYKVTSIKGNMATVLFTVNNSSTIESAFRPPVVGYTEWWSNNIGRPLTNFFSSGPLSEIKQTFRWTETIKWK